MGFTPVTVGTVELQATPAAAPPTMNDLGVRLGDSLVLDGYTVEETRAA